LGITTTLITGANRELGVEVARQLVAAGHQVWIGARDEHAASRRPTQSRPDSFSST
jgi:NAD(P)-dependent dehydrogenase (short-subunit alcohol dehydrogenase family)